MKASDIFVKALEAEGVQYIFGVPGEENLDFLEALRSSTIRFIPTRHEQAAGFMAATVGRLTGTVGVCLATLGPGATNLVTAAAYAYLGGIPMLMVTGQKPLRKRQQGHFQVVDTIEMFRPVTKWRKQIIDARNIPSSVRDACRVAEEERPGTVHIELPEDVAHEVVDDVVLIPRATPRRPIAEEKAIARAVELIHAAKRPLILIGAGANRKRTSKMLRAFIDATGIPFLNTQMGKGVVDERHPLFLGTAALSQHDYIHCAIERADLILNVGHDVVEKPPFLMTKNGCIVIHINFSNAAIDPIYFPQHEVIGDIANAIWQLSTRVQKQLHWDFSYFLRMKATLDARMREYRSDARMPVAPQQIVADVRAVLPDTGIVTLDNGMYKLWFARGYQAYAPQTLLLDNALATMGAGLPSAMAARLLFPHIPVIAVTGDGGFMMSVAELETAVRLELDLVILILSDGGYGMIDWKQQVMGFAPFGLHFNNPDFIRLAESFGAHGYRISTPTELQPLLHSCLAKKGVHVIEVPIDYSENHHVFTQELATKSCDI